MLRRGEDFNFALQLKRQYNRTTDRIRLEFSFGSEPQLDKGTLVYLPVDKDISAAPAGPYKWSAQVQKVVGNRISVSVHLPADLAIGVWSMKVSTKLNATRVLHTFAIPDALYVLFNAWCKDDDVYLDDEDTRQEYVLNDVGKIYIGSYTRPTGRKWTYGQFHESVLPTAMQLLDRTRLDVTARGDVVRVARAVSALVNSHDDSGLLVGNWSGNYGSGMAPWQWTGSAAVFDKYLQNGWRSVRFGQCWVFGGVTTTALRTLGIPARTITNFVSAHDTDLSLTVDEFYNDYGSKLSGINGDSIWNFHVWSEAWMQRHDLPPGFSGWQAIDATPQETSMGAYQLGPASLEAIKQGKVGFAYDVGFVFSEVNADLVQWRRDSRSPFGWRKSRVTRDHVGRKMYTKRIGQLDERSRFGVEDAENIVTLYKHIEGSPEERSAYSEAAKAGGLGPVLGTNYR